MQKFRTFFKVSDVYIGAKCTNFIYTSLMSTFIEVIHILCLQKVSIFVEKLIVSIQHQIRSQPTLNFTTTFSYNSNKVHRHF